MGIDSLAAIEYACRAPTGGDPFADPDRGAIDLTEYWRLRGDKDYKFLDLCLDWESVPEYRRPRRGVPADLSEELRESFADAEMPHWLTYEEIQRAFETKNFSYDELGMASQVVLEMMRFLAAELGGDRVRLIVGVE